MSSFNLFVMLLMRSSIILSLEAPCTTKLSFDGVCKPITDCLYLMDLLNAGDFGDLTSCDFDGSVGVFCCPSIYSNSTPSSISESCQKIIKLKEQLRVNTTSYDQKSSSISTGKFPHMAQVILPGKGFVGAGALISEKFVLTSAHIVFIRRSLPIVRLGKVIKGNLKQSLDNYLSTRFYF
jgi:hypothetical protein